MNDHHERIADLRDYADRTLQELNLIAAGETRRPESLRTAQALAGALYRHVGRNPSFGFIGDFSVGKSLLVTLLVGIPRLLPVSGAPTTGNVTRIRVTEDPALSVPECRGVTITYLTAAEVADLAEQMVRAIVAVDAHHPLRPGRSLAGYQPVDADAPENGDWARLADYFGPIWPDRTLSPLARRAGYELCLLRDALAVGSGLLARVPGSNPMPISMTDLGEAVRIGDSRRPPDHFPGAAPRTGWSGGRLDGRTLAATRSLVDEIVLDVAVPPRTLSTGGVPLDLVDFPGLNAVSVRDRFLIDRKMPTTTIVGVVLDARKPRSENVFRFFDILRHGRHETRLLADSLLLIANLFDGIEPPDRPVTDAGQLLRASEHLRELYAVAGELTGGQVDRMALVSGLGAALHLGWPIPVEAGSETTAAARGSSRRWGATVAGLLEVDPHRADPMTLALDGYAAADGGLAALRARLGGHVHQHGLEIWLAEAQQMRNKLEEMLWELRPKETVDGPDSRTLTALGRAVSRGIREINRRMAELRVIANAGEDGRPTLNQQINSRAAIEVREWGCWAATLEKAVDGHIAQARDNEKDLVSTGHLRDDYETVREKLDTFARPLLAGLVEQWADRVYALPAVQAMVQQLDAGHDAFRRHLPSNRWDSLSRLTGRSFLTEALQRSWQAQAPDTGYPLDRTAWLPWHPTLLDTDRSEYRTDTIRMFRLRTDVVDDLARQARRRLQATLDRMAEDLDKLLTAADQHTPSRADLR